MFYVIEGRVGSGSTQTKWWPLFRSTPWLTPNLGTLSGVDDSEPGTTGSLEFSNRLSSVMNQSSIDRGAVDEDPRNLPRPIQVVNELGRPDYDNPGSGGYPTSKDAYLSGTSVGSADDAYRDLDNGRRALAQGEAAEFGNSSLQPDNGGNLPLVNNYPGAESGYYGAASGTDQFDVGKDDTSESTMVELRYTFALYTINEGNLESFTENDLNGYNDIDEAVRQDPHLDNVRRSDIESDGQGNSVLVMDGEDGYPSITDEGAGSAADNDYDALQAIADDHPAVISTTSEFMVDVENEAADSGASGDSNTGASGGGQ